MKSIREYSIAVEETIRGLSEFGYKPASLYEPIAYGMQAGGKRLRPVLLLMGCDAFSGSFNQALHAAAGIEMFHNFTLLHDDVMDNSDLRRGRATVHKKWDSNTAILSGDCMLTLATQLIMRTDDGKLRRVLDIFNRMALRVYEGQRLDMDFEMRDDVTLPDYISMIDGKTSALLGASAEIGSVIGGADGNDSRLMYEYGLKLGIAFQIQDDYLDLYGDASTFGKPIGGDVLNDKKTFLLLSACNRGAGVRKALEKVMSECHGEAKISAVRDIMTAEMIPEECEKVIEIYSRDAFDALDRTSLNDDVKQSFRMLSEKLTGRKK